MKKGSKPFDNSYTKPKGAGGHSADHAGVETGLSMHETCNPSPSYHGMDTVGADQKPQAVPNESVSKGGKSFNIR